ncbi:MAG: nuclear transport factor 2 family protein [Bacteroidales bacterium]|nr:nuclear transport factor 2 family protein [Bacteroidales bacterium]
MKKINSISGMCLLIILALNSCTQEPVDVKTEIEAANVLFMDAANTGDKDALTEIYLPDVTICPPNSDAISGVENVVAAMTVNPPGAIKMLFETVSAEAYGKTAIELGKYKVMTPDESIVLDHGKYIVTWKKIGNEWKVSKDIWNTSNAPIPRAMAGDTVLFAITRVKEQDVHLIEEFSYEVFLPVYKELFPQDKAATRIFKTTSADKDGYVSFVYLADPVTSAQTHNVFQVLGEKYGKEKTTEMMQKYMSIFEDQTPYITIQQEW